MESKTYNIHEILEFANRAGLTLEEFQMSYKEIVEDLRKRSIEIVMDEPSGLEISPDVRRAQIGSGFFTVGIYPEIKLPKTNPEKTSTMVGMTLACNDEDGKEHRFRVHYNKPIPKDIKS